MYHAMPFRTMCNLYKWNMHIILIEFLFIQENVFENIVWEMAAIVSRPQCVT